MYLTALDNSRYLMEVDKLMCDLRGICLGYHIHLTDLLPSHLAGLSDCDKAMQLSRQLVFALTVTSSSSSEQIRKAGRWFHDVFYYLLAQCRTEDQTLHGFFQLYELSRDTRDSVFAEIYEPTSVLRADDTPPVPIAAVELAVLQLLKSSKQAEKLREPVSALYTLRKDTLSVR